MKLGQALNHAYQVYYNIADREALERLLGKDAPLLSAQRVRETLDVLRVEDRIPDDQRDTYVNPDELAKIDKPEELIKYINIFNQQGKSTRIVRAVRRLVQESIAEKFNLYLYDENGNRKKEEVVDIDFSTGKVKRDADCNSK